MENPRAIFQAAKPPFRTTSSCKPDSSGISIAIRARVPCWQINNTATPSMKRLAQFGRIKIVKRHRFRTRDPS